MAKATRPREKTLRISFPGGTALLDPAVVTAVGENWPHAQELLGLAFAVATFHATFASSSTERQAAVIEAAGKLLLPFWAQMDRARLGSLPPEARRRLEEMMSAPFRRPVGRPSNQAASLRYIDKRIAPLLAQVKDPGAWPRGVFERQQRIRKKHHVVLESMRQLPFWTEKAWGTKVDRSLVFERAKPFVPEKCHAALQKRLQRVRLTISSAAEIVTSLACACPVEEVRALCSRHGKLP